MKNEIFMTSKAGKQLDKVDGRYRQAILNTIDSLVNFPDVMLDVAKLKGTGNKYRVRVGRYRIIFEWIDGEPKIIEIQEIKKRDEQTYH